MATRGMRRGITGVKHLHRIKSRMNQTNFAPREERDHPGRHHPSVSRTSLKNKILLQTSKIPQGSRQVAETTTAGSRKIGTKSSSPSLQSGMKRSTTIVKAGSDCETAGETTRSSSTKLQSASTGISAFRPQASHILDNPSGTFCLGRHQGLSTAPGSPRAASVIDGRR